MKTIFELLKNDMKRTNIFLVAGFIITCLSLMSNSGGRAAVQGQGSTGAPGENTCGQTGCHSSGSFNPMASIRVEDMDGNQISEYFPGTTYKVILTNSATGASRYGFQITSLNATSDEFMGVWSDESTNAQITALSQRTYLEQQGTSSVNEISANWTAGEMEFGDITFYAATNAVNGNGSPSGDGTASTSLTIPQAVLSTSDIQDANLSIFPNPSSDVINISSDVSYNKFEMYDALGNMVLKNTFSDQIDISDLQSGIYLVRLSSTNNVTSIKRIIKN